MAMTWKHYGALVVVSAGVFLGGPLWWLRPSPSIRGQDAAECVASLAERKIIGTHVGTGMPSLVLSGFQTITNQIVTNYTTKVTFSLASGSFGRLRIIQGATNTFDSATWTEGTSFSVQFGYVEGGPDGYPKTFDIRRDGVLVGNVYVDSPASTYVPIGGVTTNQGVVYQPDLGIVGVYNALTQNVFTFSLTSSPTNTPYTTTNTVNAIRAVDDYMRWQTVYAMLDGARSVATSEGALLWVRKPCSEWTDGMTVLSTPREWYQTQTTTVSVASYTGETLTNVYWSARPLTTGIVDHVPALGVRWPYVDAAWLTGTSLTNTPFANRVTNYVDTTGATEPSAAVQAMGSWWGQTVGGTGYVWRCERPASDGVITNFVKWITTNNLNDARAVMGGMTTTVYVCRLSDCAATSIADVAGGEIVSRTDSGTGSQGALLGDAFITEVLAADTVNATSAVWNADELLASYTYDGAEYVNSDRALPSGTWDWSWSGNGNVQRQFLSASGVTAPHPSLYACASGYVARVRVFAVLSSYVSQAVGGGYSDPWANNDDYPITFESGTAQTTATDFDLAPQAADMLAPPDTSFGRNLRNWPEHSRAQSVFKLQQIGEWIAPSSQPSWSIGTNVVGLTLSDVTGKERWSKETIIPPVDPALGLEIQEEAAWSWYASRVKCHCIVVVTDWNWRHFGGTVWTNAAWTPAWASVTNGP